MELRNKKDVEKIRSIQDFRLKDCLFNVKSFRVFDIESMSLIDIDVDYYCRNNIVINGVDSGIKQFFKEKIEGTGKLNYIPLSSRCVFRTGYYCKDGTYSIDGNIPFIFKGNSAYENEVISIIYRTRTFNPKGNVSFRINFVNGDFGIYFGGNLVFGNELHKTPNRFESDWYSSQSSSNIDCLEYFGFTVDDRCAYSDDVMVLYDMNNNFIVPNGIKKVLLGVFWHGMIFNSRIVLTPSIKCIVHFIDYNSSRNLAKRKDIKISLFCSESMDKSVLINLYSDMAKAVGITGHNKINSIAEATTNLLNNFNISIEFY